MTSNNSYEITDKNLIKNPERYQRFPFLGREFLKDFEQSRLRVINSIKVNNQSKIKKFSDISLTMSKNQNENILTSELLRKNLKKILNNELFDEELKKIVTKFEVKRKIYSQYSKDLKIGIGSFNESKNYLILSLCNLAAFEKKHNLKYLNSSLKLNDVVCSTIEVIENDDELKKILIFVLEKELEYVKKIALDKEVLI